MTREQIHIQIKELIELIEINHGRFCLNDSSFALDLAQLRQHVVDLYTCLDQLELANVDSTSGEKVQSESDEKPTAVNQDTKNVAPAARPMFKPEDVPTAEKEIEIVAQETEPKIESRPSVIPSPAPPKPPASPPVQDKKSKEGDVYAKLRKKKLDTIKKGISVSKRYEIQNQLFENKAENYNHAIAELDKADNLKGAEQFLNELAQHYGWNDEHPLVEELLVLLQRRYL